MKCNCAEYTAALCLAEITKANEEVNRVLKLYDDVINKADTGSLLVDDNHGELHCASFQHN